MNKDYYIDKISKAGNKHGDKLLKMLDFYNVSGLRDLTLKQVKTYYEENIKNS